MSQNYSAGVYIFFRSLHVFSFQIPFHILMFTVRHIGRHDVKNETILRIESNKKIKCF